MLQQKQEQMLQKVHQKEQFKKLQKVIGNLIGNKKADKITSIGKTKEKVKAKEIEEIYIPPEKRQEIIDDLRLF